MELLPSIVSSFTAGTLEHLALGLILLRSLGGPKRASVSSAPEGRVIRRGLVAAMAVPLSPLRAEAARLWSLLGDSSRPLFDLLHDENGEVRAEALKGLTLAFKETTGLQEEVRRLLRDPFVDVRIWCLKEIQERRWVLTEDEFELVFRDQDEYVRYLALEVFAGDGKPLSARAKKLLRENLRGLCIAGLSLASQVLQRKA